MLKLVSLIILMWFSFSSMATTAFIDIADAYEKDYFERYPEEGLHLGRADVILDQFMDHSWSAVLKWQAKEDDFLKALVQLDLAEIKNSPHFQTYQLLRQRLENNQAIRVCKDELWQVNPMWGWHIMLGMIAQKQPIGTVEYRLAALKRWKGFELVVQEEINKLKQGVKEGYTAPKPVVLTVLNQIKMIISTPAENSPYFDFARRDGDALFKKKIATTIETVINPALKRYAEYLEKEYLPVARTQIGVSVLPNGEQCYQAKIRETTTLTISPAAIYDFGVKHNQRLTAEIVAIGEQEFGSKDITEIFRLAKRRTQHAFRVEHDILAWNEAALIRAKMAVPQWFSVIPKAAAILKPYPLHRAKAGAPGEYDRPSEDGSRPGIFFINTYQPEHKNRLDQEATLFHELIPGHHFQISLAMENTSRHHLTQYLWNNGYEEGWALYSERLADEMGLYKDNMSRLGMLSNESFRTARLVIDPGIHVMNWTREQAIAYLKQCTLLDNHIIEGEIDRYIMLPGQATSYMLGKREIESLRQISEEKLGEKFDIKEFHYQVLKNGSVTLPMLRDNIIEWLSKCSATQ